jgi:hypothetical protein
MEANRDHNDNNTNNILTNISSLARDNLLKLIFYASLKQNIRITYIKITIKHHLTTS